MSPFWLTGNSRMFCAKWFWRRFLNFVNVFWLFHHYFRLENCVALHLKNFYFSLPHCWQCSVPSLVEVQLWIWRWRFINIINIFSLFYQYISLEKGMALYLIKLESSTSKNALCQVWIMLCAKFGWNWMSGSSKEDDNVKSLQTD